MDASRNVAAYPRSTVFPVDALPIGASHHVIDGSVAAHRHMFVEIAVILGGSGQHIAKHGTYTARIGDVFVIHSGAWHAYAQCRQCVIANCYFGTELLDRELAWIRQDSSVAPLLRVPSATQQTSCHPTTRLSANGCKQYRSVLDQLVRNVQNPQPVLRVECLGLLITALGILTQALTPVPVAAAQARAAIHPAVRAGQRMLDQQIEYPWTLVELAYQLHIDRSYLVRLFKQHTGLAPMTFLAHRRAERAAMLLRTTAQPISAIGCAVGWYDLNQFNRRFKAIFGTSASVYRAQSGFGVQ